MNSKKKQKNQNHQQQQQKKPYIFKFMSHDGIRDWRLGEQREGNY